MQSKDILNLIISLIVLAAGVKIIAVVAKSYIPASPAYVSPELLASVDAISNLFILGTGVLVLILLPFYFSKKSEEKKVKR